MHAIIAGSDAAGYTIPGMGKKGRRIPQERRSQRIESRYSVFVSHATADKWIASAICEKIEGVGAATFRDDRDIGGGDDIPDEIRRQIIRSDEMVVLLTPESANRKWVLFELGAMWGRKQKARIVTILCHVQVDAIPDLVASKKSISPNDLDEYLSELRGRVAKRRS